MKHHMVLMAVLVFDHWLANTERVAASSILGLLFRIFESTLILIKRTLSRSNK